MASSAACVCGAEEEAVDALFPTVLNQKKTVRLKLFQFFKI